MLREKSRIQSIARRHPLECDAALSIVLACTAFFSLAVTYGQEPANNSTYSHGYSVEVVIVMLAVTLPLALRRRFPFSTGVIVVSAFLVGRIVVHVPEANITGFALWLAMYSVALHGELRIRTPILTLLYFAVIAELARELFFTGDATPIAAGFALGYNMVVIALPGLLGLAIRGLRDRQSDLEEQAIELSKEREDNAREAVFAERVRIARELHDVVAHHVSVIGVQAAGARRSNGPRSRTGSGSIELDRGFESASGFRASSPSRFSATSRRSGGPFSAAWIAQLSNLIAEARASQLNVDLTISGESCRLSPTLELSVYRIIQEAITNARKHSNTSMVSVRLKYAPGKFLVEIFDGGPAIPHDADAHTGHGLIGMRERASLHGGQLLCGGLPGGGYSVRATFPLPDGQS